jgi:signal peptidase I
MTQSFPPSQSKAPAPPSSAGQAPSGKPPAAAATASKKRPERGESSVKETIESILVAFILAFIFRAFIVEAFVIPTGSMAPTLLGAHMRFTCSDCGYPFQANYSDQSGADEIRIPRESPHTHRVFCPNCGYKLPENRTPGVEDDRHSLTRNPPVHYGDRILVLKYLYLFEDPQRWDVVVFKSPYEPEKWHYQQNYIKRLVGRPRESVLILDGDIYVGQPGDENPETFKIQTKPRYVQDALWRVIYDNDYVPQRRPRLGARWQQPWTVRSGDGWRIGDAPTPDARVFRFDNANGESTIFFNREVNGIANRGPDDRPYAFTDWLAYDASTMNEPYPPEHNIVHDLKLSFVYDRSAGDGPLRAKITRGGDGTDEFIAVLTATNATLVYRNRDGERVIGKPLPLPADGRPRRVELTHVDYEAALRIDDVEVARTTPEDYRPDIPRLLKDFQANTPQPLPTVEIAAANQTAALTHIGLWRDIYYINRPSGAAPPGSGLYWGTPIDLPGSIMRLGPDEYFVLGDNSLISGDARYWRQAISLPADGNLQVRAGIVPKRFMLGRAFFVYWPAGYRPASMGPGLAPNFGDMRFIR